MNIVITTGIFPPESGGPATYAPKLAEGLVQAGHTVTVITLSVASQHKLDNEYDFAVVRIARGSKLSNYLRYARAVFFHTKTADMTYSLSYFSLGFIVSLVALLRRTPYVVRIGGAYLWEHFYLYNNDPIPLRDFYDQKLYRQYPLRFRILRHVLGWARTVVFNSKPQAEMYHAAYNLTKSMISVIPNPVPETDFGGQRTQPKKEIVFAGRFVPMKNIDTLVHAFKQADLPDYNLTLIGDGPHKPTIARLVDELGLRDRVTFVDNLPQDTLFTRIANTRLVVLPSWTDICPNFIFECTQMNIPFVVTEENFLPFRDQIPNMINPRSVNDLADTLQRLTRDEDAYQKHVQAIESITFDFTWSDVIDDHRALFNEIV